MAVDDFWVTYPARTALAIAAAWIPVLAFEPSVGIYTAMLMAAVCALAAAAVTRAPWTAIVGTLSSVFGPLAFATDIGDNEPGFPAMLIVLGIMAAPDSGSANWESSCDRVAPGPLTHLAAILP